MQPLGIALIGLAIILIVIGVMGSQHAVLKVFKGIPGEAKKTAGKGK